MWRQQVNIYFSFKVVTNFYKLLLLSHLYGGGFVDIFTSQIHNENDYQIQ